mmetsp:Transcript_10839/g.21192  ORF Transcript_10839/g.21192 Transcript_10839/m.21192 type:complete len:288 (-) Transcript_10839:1183-2046(-)
MTLEVVLFTITSVSVLSTFVVFISYLAFPDLRTPIYRAITYLALSDFVWELLVIICQFDNTSETCPAYSYLITAFQMSSVAWTIYIAYVVKDSIMHNREHLPKYSWWVYPLACIIVPLGISALPFITDSYKKSNLTWCFMAKSGTASISLWFIGIFTVPLIIGLTYCAIAYNQASRLMTQNISVIELSTSELRKRIQYIRKLKIFPLILVVCWVPGFVVEFVLLVSSYDLAYLDKAFALLSCCQGVLNAFAYSYSSILGYYLKHRFCPGRQREERFRDELIDDLLNL